MGLCILGAARAGAQTPVQASLQPATVPVGETAELQITFENCQPEAVPAAPTAPGLTIQFLGTSQSMSWNSASGQIIKLICNYSVTATKEGEYTVPPVRCRINGRDYQTEPQKLTVTKSPDDVLARSAFLQWRLPKTNLFVGETLTVELWLLGERMAQEEPPQIESEGFTMGRLQRQSGQTRINNKTYQASVFRTYIIPIRPGNLQLGPVSLRVAVPKPGGNRRGNPLFGFFGEEMEFRAITVTAEPIPLKVEPLPTAGQPTNFSGAVGRFECAVSANPTNIAVGDPVTLKIELRGDTLLENVNLPSLSDWKGFKAYPPTSKLENANELGLGGSKYFELSVVPQSLEVRELPPFQFSFFDPASRSYRTISGPRLPLIVRPSLSAQTPVVNEATNTVDIVQIKPRLGVVAAIEAPLVFRPWFVALQGLPLAAWLGLRLRRRHLENLANNPRLRRQRETAKIIAAGLKELSELAAANKSDEFFALVFRLLQEQIGERLDLPASAITEAVIAERLRPAGVAAETLAGLEGLFQVCNQARYAPQKTAGELDSIAGTLRQTLQALQQVDAAKAARSGAGAVVMAMLALLGGSARAADAAGEFENANRLYEQSKFAAAAAAYQQMVEHGQVSPALYFNLGNALFRSGQAGRAIAAYRQAEMLAPRDPDIRGNLTFVRKAVLGGDTTEAKASTWLEYLTLDEWAGLAAVCFWLWLGALAAGHWRPALWSKGWLRRTAYLGFVGFALLALCLSLNLFRRLTVRVGVVMQREVPVRQGPFDESKNIFVAKDGTEFIIVDADKDWYQVRDLTSRAGWIKTNQVQMLPAFAGRR